MFNVLLNGMGFDIAGKRVLDMFAGTGALGIEAISRGAGHVTFLEINRGILSCVSENVESLGIAGRSTLACIDATIFRPLRGEGFDLVFIDPPYRKSLADRGLITAATAFPLNPGAVVVTETGADEEIQVPVQLKVTDERVYGAAKIWFLAATE